MPDGRIVTLDVVRGVAVLGILVMNIVGFGLPLAAYLNPAAAGRDGPADGIAWALAFILVDGKMRGLFSLLFGASLLLVADRAQAAGRSPASVHYRRMGWLAGFGAAHLYLVWWGDILLHYAIVGSVAFVLRRAGVHKWLTIAALLLSFQLAIRTQEPIAIGETDAAVAADPTPRTLAYQRRNETVYGHTDGRSIMADIAVHRGDYATILAARWHAQRDGVWRELIGTGSETLAFMLLGMAALRNGLLAGAWPRSRYRRWAAIGLGSGIIGFALLAWLDARNGFSAYATALYVVTLPTLLRPAMIVGWACLIVLLTGRSAITRTLAATGRMAFSNYLLASLLATTVFYGYGLGLYGALSRAQLYLVALPIMFVTLVWSPWWLARYRYGPLEWVWRSLTQRRVIPLKIATASH